MERFWRTLKEDLITEPDFDSTEEFRDELMQYMLHYNQQKPHQGIMGNSSWNGKNKCQQQIN